MITSINSEKDFNELIFENRNKEYGAYALRDSYGNTVTKSMLITLSGVLFLIAIVFYLSQGVAKLPDLGINLPPELPQGTTIIIDPPKEKIVEPKTPVEPSKPKTDNGNWKASDEENKTINKINENLVISKIPSDSGTREQPGPEIPEIIEKKAPVENNKAEAFVTNMPEFKGNVYQFIKNNLRYPAVALENGTAGLVMLSFIIEKDGSIGEIKVLNDIPDGCTQEAIRVVRLMPAWKPGMNNGVPARVIYNLPVYFRLQ
jgi:periplasmic protein TonB